MLADAGFPDGFDTTIYYRDVFRVYLPEPGAVAVDLQTQLAENLGQLNVVLADRGDQSLETATADRPEGTSGTDFQ